MNSDEDIFLNKTKEQIKEQNERKNKENETKVGPEVEKNCNRPHNLNHSCTSE